MNNFVDISKAVPMKFVRLILLATTISFVFSSCSLWNKMFGPKYGCPSNGKNVGAEKLLDDPKAAKKAKKFKS
jgi:hypothetical protein